LAEDHRRRVEGVGIDVGQGVVDEPNLLEERRLVSKCDLVRRAEREVVGLALSDRRHRPSRRLREGTPANAGGHREEDDAQGSTSGSPRRGCFSAWRVAGGVAPREASRAEPRGKGLASMKELPEASEKIETS